MKLDAISIITADMPAAITFYSALGLELADGGPDAPHTEFSSGSLRILLDTEAVVLGIDPARSEEHTSELQSRGHLVCRLLLEKKKNRNGQLEASRCHAH